MTPVYHYDLEQRSDEWHRIRSGLFTGSDAHFLMIREPGEPKAKKGAKNPVKKPETFQTKYGLGKGAETAIYLKCAQLLSNFEPYEFDKYELRIGREREPEAIERYEDLIFPESVTACGFVTAGNYLGVSPDGLVGKDGGVEVKCLQPPAYLEYLINRNIDPKHLAQVHWCMFITGRKWWDYVMFNPDFGGHPIDVTRIHRDEKLMELFSRKAAAIETAMTELLFQYENLSA